MPNRGWFYRLAAWVFWAVGAIGLVATTRAYLIHPHHPGAVWWLVAALGIVAVRLVADVITTRWRAHRVRVRQRRIRGAPELTGETFNLWDLLTPGERGVVSNRVFRRCIIRGPGVIFQTGTGSMTACTLGIGADVDQISFEAPSTPHVKQGLVAFIHCDFDRCTFEGIAFYGDKEFLARLKDVPQI